MHSTSRVGKSASSKLRPRPDCDSRSGGRCAPGVVRLGENNKVACEKCMPYRHGERRRTLEWPLLNNIHSEMNRKPVELAQCRCNRGATIHTKNETRSSVGVVRDW